MESTSSAVITPSAAASDVQVTPLATTMTSAAADAAPLEPFVDDAATATKKEPVSFAVNKDEAVWAFAGVRNDASGSAAWALTEMVSAPIMAAYCTTEENTAVLGRRLSEETRAWLDRATSKARGLVGLAEDARVKTRVLSAPTRDAALTMLAAFDDGVLAPLLPPSADAVEFTVPQRRVYVIVGNRLGGAPTEVHDCGVWSAPREPNSLDLWTAYVVAHPDRVDTKPHYEAVLAFADSIAELAQPVSASAARQRRKREKRREREREARLAACRRYAIVGHAAAGAAEKEATTTTTTPPPPLPPHHIVDCGQADDEAANAAASDAVETARREFGGDADTAAPVFYIVCQLDRLARLLDTQWRTHAADVTAYDDRDSGAQAEAKAAKAAAAQAMEEAKLRAAEDALKRVQAVIDAEKLRWPALDYDQLASSLVTWYQQQGIRVSGDADAAAVVTATSTAAAANDLPPHVQRLERWHADAKLVGEGDKSGKEALLASLRFVPKGKLTERAMRRTFQLSGRNGVDRLMAYFAAAAQARQDADQWADRLAAAPAGADLMAVQEIRDALLADGVEHGTPRWYSRVQRVWNDLTAWALLPESTRAVVRADEQRLTASMVSALLYLVSDRVPSNVKRTAAHKAAEIVAEREARRARIDAARDGVVAPPPQALAVGPAKTRNGKTLEEALTEARRGRARK